VVITQRSCRVHKDLGYYSKRVRVNTNGRFSIAVSVVHWFWFVLLLFDLFLLEERQTGLQLNLFNDESNSIKIILEVE
jgi:hypothetical protein